MIVPLIADIHSAEIVRKYFREGNCKHSSFQPLRGFRHLKKRRYYVIELCSLDSLRPRFLRIYVASFLCLLSLSIIANPAYAQQRLTDNVERDPAKAVIVFEDIERFLEAREAIANGWDGEDALQSLYFDRASPGLRMFMEKYDLGPERLIKAMAKHPEAYERIPEVLRALRINVPSFRKTYRDIAEIVPEAVFPATYFVVAGHRGIGSGSIEGPLISVEKRSAATVADLAPTLVHEMIHMQQLAAVGEAYFEIFSGPGRNLLALSIREGAATFFAEVIAGGSKRKNQARAYLASHEAELWQAFQKDMLSGETGDWLWKKPTNPEQPQDMGYAMGARIVEVFYENAEDKGRAASEVMAITNYPAFLERSGYVP